MSTPAPVAYVTQSDLEDELSAVTVRRIWTNEKGVFESDALRRACLRVSRRVDLGVQDHYPGPFPLTDSPIAEGAHLAALEFLKAVSCERHAETIRRAPDYLKRAESLMKELQSASMRLGLNRASQTVGAFAPDPASLPAALGGGGLYPPTTR
jgi:hypothetical protein